MKKIFIFSFLSSAQFFFTQSSDIIWSKNYGGSNRDVAARMTKISDGNFVIIGDTKSIDGDVTGSNDLYKAWMAMGNTSSGQLSKNKFIYDDIDLFGKDIKQTTDGGFVILGNYNVNVSGEIFVTKLDANGQLEWKKNYPGVEAMSIEVCNDGGYLFGSQFGMRKIDSNGESMWYIDKLSLFRYGMQNREGTLMISDLINSQVTLSQYKQNGEILWKRTYDNGKANDIRKVIQSADGGYVIVGSTFDNNFNYRIIKTDSNGNLVWDKSYGGSSSDFGHGIIEDSEGNFIISGNAYSTNGNITKPKGLYDSWLIKLNPQGDLIWENSYGGSNDDGGGYYHYGTDIMEVDNGDLLMSSFSKSSDGDVPANKGDYDYWVYRIKKPMLTTTEVKSLKFDVFPNPFMEQINIKGDDKISQIKIFNVSGQLVYNEKIDSQNAVSISTNDLPVGIYFISVHTYNGNKVFKVIK